MTDTAAADGAAPGFDPPLAGLRVLDLSAGPALAIGRLYADLGAEVVHVDLDGVSAAAPFGPVVDGVDLAAALATAGMPRVRVEPGGDAWGDLVAGCGILIESTLPGSPAEAALDVAGLRRAHPGLVVLSVSDFGRDTRFATWRATSPVLAALSSVLSRSGEPGREPLLPPGDLPFDAAVTQAAVFALALHLDRLRTGEGERIDFAMVEGATAAIDPPFGMAGSAALGKALADLPRGRTDESHKYPIFRCADGWVRICVLARRQWRGLFEWMGSPEEFADPRLDLLHVRYRTPALLPAVGAFLAAKTRAEVEEEGQRFGVPTAGVRTAAEALGSVHIAERGFLAPREVAPGLVASVPVGLAEIDGVRAGAGAGGPDAVAPAVGGAFAERPARPGLPLAGLRVVDLGVIIVGGDSTRLLADLGAEVVKVEHSAFADGARQSLPPGRMMAGFASGHRNKSSLGLDLSDPEGRALLHRLLAVSDAVVSNFKPGTLERLGLGAEALRERHPHLVAVDSSAFGSRGPWATWLGYGPLVRAATGFTERWVYPDAQGRFQDDITAYPDHAGARISTLLVLALLIRRERTGRGGTGGFAQAELMLSHMMPTLLAERLETEGRQVRRPERTAPWGVFPAAGEDDWLVVTVRDEGEWQALTRTIGRDDLAADPALDSPEGRFAHRERIDRAVAAWTSRHPAEGAMELLQAAGVPAGAMLRGADLPAWEHSVLRRAYRTETHPFAHEPFTLEDVQLHAERVAPAPDGFAPMLGEQTAEIARRLLRLEPEEIAGLLERGILESPPLPTPTHGRPPATPAAERTPA